MKAKLVVILLTLALPAMVGKKKPIGKVPDPQALAGIQSYCVATGDLPANELYEVEGFLKQERAAKGLLTKLPWKTVADCREGNPDAVVKVEFVQLRDTGLRLGDRTIDQARGTNRDEPPYRVKAVLEVREPASDRLLYQAQATPLDNSSQDSPMMADAIPGMVRRNALYNVFETLIRDLTIVNPK